MKYIFFLCAGVFLTNALAFNYGFKVAEKNCQYNLISKRTLQGCEAVASQCLDDVMNAEWREKRCLYALEQMTDALNFEKEGN